MQQIEWRRSQVLELSSKGHNQSEISKILQIDKSIISRDISFLREQSKQNIRKYVDEKLPIEYEKCLVGLTAILKEAWNSAQQSSDKKEKIHALSLAKECYAMKLELLTNATVVDDAIRFVTSNSGAKGRDSGAEKDKAVPSDINFEYTKDDIQGSKENNSIRNSTHNKIF
jgi:hypothetical protein